ncbi:MAG: hypothetical protein O7E53_07230 [Alphaproteobacteria bacterium]|nr:hypothetical protein [Alphaproteobacteria bacterium]
MNEIRAGEALIVEHPLFAGANIASKDAPVAEDSKQQDTDLKTFQLQDAEIGRLIGLTNQALADEAHLKDRIAIVRGGERLTDQLAIAADSGWFQPMLNDLLRQGVSVVVNDIPIADASAADIGKHANLPPSWISQQNLYITPQESQGFDPHCDPHIVVVVHLYGRKEWTIFDKVLENPVYDADTNTIAGKSEQIGVREQIVVEPGDCFVIPRGRYHSAVALSPASVHLAIGTAGVRAVDYLWTMSQQAIGDATMRADMTPEEALQKARDFMAAYAFEPIALPRFKRAVEAADPAASSFSFEGVLDAL